MRTWFLHPILFFPLVALVAVLLIALSARPQSWPKAPAPVAGQQAGAALVLQGASFDAPQAEAQQTLNVPRDFLGQAQSLRVAVLPNQPAPGANESGVRILLAPSAAVALGGRPVSVVVTYNPLPVNAATGLALSLEGAGPNAWVSQDAPPQHGTLRFELPARTEVNAIGLRAISANTGQREAYGLEITRISITPHP